VGDPSRDQTEEGEARLMLKIRRSIDESVRSKLREFARSLREDEEVRARVRRAWAEASESFARDVNANREDLDE